MPTLNVDKIAALNKSVEVQLNKLGGVNVITGNSRKVSDVDNSSGNNKNYYSSHPPEVFFVQEIGKETIYPFMLNFVPTDPNKEFGQNNKWTGTLYEWNLTGDTLVVQELKDSKIAKRYGVKMQKQGVSQQAKIFENGNTLNGLSDKKISGAWADFWHGVGEAINKIWGEIGEFFGVASDDPFDGHDHAHWNTIDWNAIGNFFTNLVGDGAGTSGSGSFGNTGSGYGLYSSYTPGIQNPSGYNDANGSNPIGGGSNNSAPNWVDVPGNTTYPTGGHNNNQPVYSLELSNLLSILTLTPSQIDFLQSRSDIVDQLHEFLDDNGSSTENRGFAQWAVGYLNENRDVTWPNFSNRFITNLPPYKLDIYIRNKYPKFTSIADGLVFFLASNPKVVAALTKYSGFDKNQIMELATNNSGPVIKLSNESWTTIANGAFNAKVSDNTIFLSEDNVAMFERTFLDARVKYSLAFSLMVTILYETVHYGRFQNGLPDPNSTHDFGTKFEELGFGFNVEFQLHQPVIYKMYYLP